jgi:diacylglycerol kinase
MTVYFQKLFRSITNALNGILIFISEERNAKTQLFVTLVVIVCGFYFQLSKTEWIFTILAIALVIITEAVNTAIERLSDVVTSDYNEGIKKVKDIAAGAVFIAAIFSIIIGLFIFLPKILYY